MAEEWVKNSRNETRAALDARDTAEAQLGALKDKQAQMAEQVKQALRDKDSAKAGLKTTERQAEDLRKELHYCEINLATEKQMVTDLRGLGKELPQRDEGCLGCPRHRRGSARCTKR